MFTSQAAEQAAMQLFHELEPSHTTLPAASDCYSGFNLRLAKNIASLWDVLLENVRTAPRSRLENVRISSYCCTPFCNTPNLHRGFSNRKFSVCQGWTAVLQYQLVDAYYQRSRVHTGISRKLVRKPQRSSGAEIRLSCRSGVV